MSILFFVIIEMAICIWLAYRANDLGDKSWIALVGAGGWFLMILENLRKLK